MDIFEIGLSESALSLMSASEIRAGSSDSPDAFSHVDLAAPCVHPWLLRLARALLGHPLRDIEMVTMGDRHLVIQPGGSPHRIGDPLWGEELESARQAWPDFVALTHGEALVALLEDVDLERRRAFVAERLATAPPNQKPGLEAMVSTIDAAIASNLRPRDLVLDALPIPPSTLCGTSTADDSPAALYRRLRFRNERSARVLAIGPPESIVRITREQLQTAVDDVLTVGIGKMAIELRSDDEPALPLPARLALAARAEIRDPDGGDPIVDHARTRDLRLDGAREILASVRDRDPRLIRALCATLRT